MECNFLCEICGAKFVTAGRFANHYQAKHTEDFGSQRLHDAVDSEYSSVGSNSHLEERETPVLQPQTEQFFGNEAIRLEAPICLYDEDDKSSTLSADSTYNEEVNFGNEEEPDFNEEVSSLKSTGSFFQENADMKLPTFSTVFKNRFSIENFFYHFTSGNNSSTTETGINVETGDSQENFLGEDFNQNFDFTNALETHVRESMLNPPVEFQFQDRTKKLLDIVPQPDVKTTIAVKRGSVTEQEVEKVKESVCVKKTRCRRSDGDQDQTGDNQASSVMTWEQSSPNFTSLNTIFPLNQVPATKCVATDDKKSAEEILKTSPVIRNVVIDSPNPKLINTQIEQNKSSNKDNSEKKEYDTIQQEEAAIVRQKNDRASDIVKELSYKQQQENAPNTEKSLMKTQFGNAVKNINRASDVSFISPLRNIQIKKVVIPGRNVISDARHQNTIYRPEKSSSIINLSNFNSITDSDSSQSSVIAQATERVIIRNDIGILNENPPLQMQNINLTVAELFKESLEIVGMNLTVDELFKEPLETGCLNSTDNEVFEELLQRENVDDITQD